MPEVDDYDRLLDARTAADSLATRGSLLVAQGTNPDAYAQSVQLGRRVGLPPDVVDADPAPHAAQVALNDYDRVLDANPKLRAFLADPVNAKLAHDDVAGLGRVETSMTALGSFKRGVDLLQSTLYGAAEWAGEAAGSRDLSAWGGEGRRRNEAEAASHGNRSSFLGIRGAGDFAQWGKETLAEQLPLMSPTLGGALVGGGVGFLAGGPPGAAVGALAGGFAPSLVMGIGETQGNLKQKDPNASAPGWVAAGGTAVGLLDTVVPGKIGGRLVTALGKEAAEAVASGGIKAAAGALLKGATLEGATEAAQEAIGDMAAAQGANQAVNWKELAPQMVEAAAAGFFMGGTFEGGARGIESLARHRDAVRAESAAAAVTDALSAVQDSKLAARDPERMRDLVRQIAGEDGAVHVPAASLQALYQSGVIDHFALEDWNVSAQLPEALAAGGDVIIPVDRFLTARASPEVFSQVIRNLRLAPTDMTVTEAEAYMADPRREKDITDLLESLFAANDTARPGQIVEDDVTRSLMATGLYREPDARASAVLIRERMAQRARDRGMDPDALWLEEKPTILGPSPRLAVDDLDLVLERLRSGNEVKPPRQPVLDVFRHLGGVKPQSPLAQELAAMGITPKTAPGLFRSQGMAAADTIVASEHEVLRDNQLATDANGYADPNALMQAVAREWAGDPLQTMAEQDRAARLDAPVRELRSALEANGIIPEYATKAEVLRLMERSRDGGSALNQAFRPRHAIDFTRKLDALKAGTLERGAVLEMGPTPPALVLAGLPRLPLIYKQSEAHKTLLGKHADTIDEETLRRLPDLLADPILTFRQDQGRIAALIQDGRGQDVLVVLHPSAVVSNRKANIVVTTHAKQRADKVFRAMEEGRITYRHNGRSLAWFDQARNQSPGREPARGFDSNIPTNADLDNGNGVLSQPDGGMDVRGSFDPLSDTIRLFDNANLSTFLHESGHHWLFQMIRDLQDQRLTAEARDRIQSDLQTVFDWMKVGLNVKDAHPSDLQAGIAVWQHEKWARGVEAYMMEGKAPSSALEGVFARFSSWLIRIYAKVRNLSVKLTPEVRGVMDRLLASEEAIAAQRSDPVYRIPSDLLDVFTPAERREIEAAEERAAREARQELQGRVMRELSRERLAWWKEERTKLRTEVEDEIRQRPAYRVMDLARGIGPDGQKLIDPDTGEKRALRLDRKALVAEYGEEIVKLLPQGVTATRDGINHHILAGMIGLPGGDALRLALMEAKANPLRDAVERETDQRMRQRHGDMVTDGRIAEDAADIVATGRQLDVVALQAKALRRLAGSTIDKAAARRQAEQGAGPSTADRARVDEASAATDQTLNAGVPAQGAVASQVAEEMARAQSRAAPLQRTAQRAAVGQVRNLLKGMDHAAIREAASRFLAARPVRQAVAAESYRAQARRHGRAAELAVAARDYEAAADAKEQQLLNLELEAQARRARVEVGKVERKARKINASDRDLAKSTDQDFFRAARAILSHYGLARPDPEFDTRVWLDRVRGDDPAGAADIEAMIANLTNLPAAGRVAVRIGPDGRQSETAPGYRDMKLSDLRELRDGVNALLSMGRNARSAEIEGERVEFAGMVAEMRAQLDGRLKDQDLSRDPTPAERRGMRLLGLIASGKRMESWTHLADSGETGPFTRYLLRPVLAAVYAYRDAQRSYLTRIRDLLAPARDDLARPRTIAAPELGFEFSTKGQLLHAIAHSGNDSNLRKLLLGRPGWGQVNRDGSLDRSRWDAFMSRMFDEGIITKADMDMVQGLWGLLEETKGAAQTAHRRMFGFTFKEIAANPVHTPWGPYRGGYVPAVTDKAQTNDGGRHLDADAISSGQNAAMFPAAERGFTKGRVDYNQPLALDLSLIPAHVNKVLLFSHVGPAIRQAARLVRRADFGELMGRYDRSAVTDLIEPWLHRTARQTLETPATGEGGRAADSIFRYLRLSSGMQAMVGNLVNAAQQVTGIASAALVVPPAALARSLITVWRDPAMTREAITGKSAFMRNRMDSAAREMSADIESMLKPRSLLGKARDAAQHHGYFAQTIMQDLVDRVVWAASYDHWTGKGLADAEAVARADSAVRASQGSFAPEDVSRVESGPAWARLFTMFYSYFNAQANMLGTQAAIALRQSGWRGAAGRLAAIYLFGGFLPAVVAEAITQAAKGDLGDEDEDGWADDLAELFLLSQLRYFAAFVPGLGQSVNLLANQWNDKPYDDRMSTSPVVGMVEGAVRATKTVPMALFSDGDKSRATADGINAIGTLLGLPLGWLRKPVSYAVDVAEGDSRPRHAGNVVSGILTGQDGTAH